MIRDRVALALVAVPVGFMVLLAVMASTGASWRPLDAAVLVIAALLQLGLVVTWAFIPRLPKWIVAGYGLILIALGFGVTIAGPIGGPRAPDLTVSTPVLWGLIGLGGMGLLTILAAIIHSPSEATSDL